MPRSRTVQPSGGSAVSGRPEAVDGRRSPPTARGQPGASGPASHPSSAHAGHHRAGRATIRDVAARAGVSTATVSRVLAGIGSPKPMTAAAVKAAVDDLGYRPSGVARSLRMRRTRTFGLIVTDIQNPFFPELVQSADIAARPAAIQSCSGAPPTTRAG